MSFRLFKNKKLATQEIKSALQDCLDIMEKKCISNIKLGLYEIEPAETISGWIDSRKKLYYPLEVLPEDEKELIEEEKSYQKVSLVQGEMPGIIKYEAPSIENVIRTRVIPLLPVGPTSNSNYVTNIYYSPIDEISEEWANENITCDIIYKAFYDGFLSYRKTTESLFEQAGVYDSLKKLEYKKYPLEELLLKLNDKVEKI